MTSGSSKLATLFGQLRTLHVSETPFRASHSYRNGIYDTKTNAIYVLDMVKN